MYNFRTDLADERRDQYRKANKLENEIPGIESEEETNGENIKVTRVKIKDQQGAEALGKAIGNYITIDVKNLKIAAEEEIQIAAESLGKEIKQILDMHIDIKDDILVVGLGNLHVTPDALGPKVISYIDITRHLLNYAPEFIDKDTRPVSAISPGVLGTTGIETFEIVKGVIDNTSPKLIIVIDALASRSIERISNTIQLADTGISPGNGVGNKRKDLSKDTLGIPVIAVGVPTVVEAATIAADSLDLFLNKMKEEYEKQNSTENNNIYNFINTLQNENKYEMIKEALIPEDYNFIVTPKEIDDLIDNMSNVIARGINISLQ